MGKNKNRKKKWEKIIKKTKKKEDCSAFHCGLAQ